jgi:hypothetical protein
VFSATADYALGDPWHEDTHLPDAALLAKFNVMTGFDANGDTPPALAQAVMNIAESPVSHLTEALNAHR